MLVFKHPKYYKELKRIAKREELKRASTQASKQASKREGGPASFQAGNEPTSAQAQLVRKPKRAR